MSFSNNGRGLPKERLISEPVTPVTGSFNASSMAAGEPGVPMAFKWRGTRYCVARIVETRKSLRGCRSGSGEQYVNKHFFRVETESGETMTLYRARTGSKHDGWILYTIEDPSQARQANEPTPDESGPHPCPADGSLGGEQSASRADVPREPRKPIRLAVLVSGGGTNLQALIDAKSKAGSANDYAIETVIADRPCFALERAQRHGIPAVLAVPPEGLPRAEARKAVSARVLTLAREADADALILAGFLTIMTGDVITEYSGRIINLHPALLPKFGGKGMWGHHVHEAVLASGDAESGCTVHLVDAGCDTGEILLQKKTPVLPGDTAETLAARIALAEHEAIVEGTRLLAKRLSGGGRSR